mmetsp:Transcript_18685/g.56485  ORF Transcript_18685/g.56485 Transcript_18685/m.56485 type:complete len:605 (-) Transcript_18685:704-2518(-)
MLQRSRAACRLVVKGWAARGCNQLQSDAVCSALSTAEASAELIGSHFPLVFRRLSIAAQPLGHVSGRPAPVQGTPWGTLAAVGAAAAAAGGVAWLNAGATSPLQNMPAGEEGAHLVNWSGTHEVHPRRLYQPETLEELQAIVAGHHQRGEKLRPVGSALSPNGLGFADGGEGDMVSCSLMDKVVEVDRVSGRVHVQAGARIAEVVEQLRPHGLTLQNIASIREQAMGGFLQVGAHGTGATVPPMDEQVVAFTLVTPGRGTLHLSKDDPDPELFHLTRVGLGACGVVAEVTLQCIPAHDLLEHTYVTDLKSLKENHAKTLQNNRHARYMWIPHTDAVVVVTLNPHKDGERMPRQKGPSYTEPEKTAAFQKLFLDGKSEVSPQEVAQMTFSELRDALLSRGALDRDWVRRINEAEADFWRRNSGYRCGPSDSLLGFDCGGQQWVLETAFPAGTLQKPSGADLQYMEQLLGDIEAMGIGAPAPIEQRWCSRSASAMSPAAALDPDAITSWVGIIMYLPEADEEGRASITAKFKEYVAMAEAGVAARFGAVPHWAKAEIPAHPAELRELRARLAQRYPTVRFAAARRQLDPKGILSNTLVDTLLPVAT